MIAHLLQPLICERFLTDARYREGHLRVVNALPERRVVGLHSPEIKSVAKQLAHEGDEGNEFARLLQSSGVATTHIQTEGTMHGFDMAQRSKITQHQIAERCKWLSEW